MRLLVLFALVFVAHARSMDPLAPHVTVNLDLAPQDRWTNILVPLKDEFGPILQFVNSLIPPAVQKVLDPIIDKLDVYLPYPYADEMRGVANATGIDLALIMVLNVIYDLSAFCTSIVAQNDQGVVLHARNLDYAIPGLQNITIQVDYTSGGVVQYSTTSFAGYVGVLTGMRPGAWAVTVNERNVGPSILDNIAELLTGAKFLGFALRDALENNATFQSAIQTLQHTRFMAGSYLTVSGANAGEACIITRDREDPADVWFITPPTLWNILETNDDHWLPPEDGRRAVAMAGMAAMGQHNVTLDGIYDVLSTPPVLNSWTRYTTLMSPQLSLMQTYVRDYQGGEEELHKAFSQRRIARGF